MGKFDLSRIVGAADVSESDTELREISLEKLMENRANFYPPIPQPDQEELEDSIEANGLLEPLVVVQAGEQYRLISGHNRLRALRQLNAKSDGKAYKTALCRVLPPMDEAAELAAIIEFNRQRKKTPAILADEARRLTESYRKRIDAGEKLPGRIRDRVAEAMQVSATKLANLNAIKNGLSCDDFRNAWEHGLITESCALEIARMDPGEQERLDTWLSDEKIPCTLRTVREFSVLSIKLEHDCERAGRPCPNARAMYAAFFRNGCWEGCCGCCAMCLKRDTCETCCQYVERKAPAPEPAPPISEPKPGTDWQREREAFGARLRKAREATGLDKEAFAARIGAYKATYSAWENGDIPGSTRFPELARALGVSTDYLYGLTDDSTPPGAKQPQPEGQLTIAGWMPGSCSPAEPGEFAVLVDVGNTHYFKTFMRWDGTSWLMLPSGQQAAIQPSWWLRLPPVPEKGETV